MRTGIRNRVDLVPHVIERDRSHAFRFEASDESQPAVEVVGGTDADPSFLRPDVVLEEIRDATVNGAARGNDVCAGGLRGGPQVRIRDTDHADDGNLGEVLFPSRYRSEGTFEGDVHDDGSGCSRQVPASSNVAGRKHHGLEVAGHPLDACLYDGVVQDADEGRSRRFLSGVRSKPP